MADIKKEDAYFCVVVRNSYKDEYRANDNFYKHISSVGDEADIQQQAAPKATHIECDIYFIEQQLFERDLENWLLFMDNLNLRKALLALTETNRMLIHMLYVKRFNQTECAKVLGITQGAVAQRHTYIKNFIKNFLDT